MSQSILIQKTLKFSAEIIKLQQYLTKEKKETIISKQIIRSATSIGAKRKIEISRNHNHLL